jgi:hypothetical protein
VLQALPAAKTKAAQSVQLYSACGSQQGHLLPGWPAMNHSDAVHMC